MQQQTSMSSTTMAYPTLPASPTLTNPDMILPYGEYDTTPSPPQRPIRSSLDWKDEGVDLGFPISPSGHMQMGLGQMTPTTPIIYGNGTMLSDIGEVTEVESTPGRKPSSISSRPQRDYNSGNGTVGYQTMLKRSKTGSHQRMVSVESASTVTTEEQTAELFEDFDDSVSVDDSNFQGDDEESVVEESYDQRLAEAQARVLMRKESQLFGNDDAHSSAALSRRAEMILANAKKRLDNMEGNLTRARSSLYITPSSSMSSMRESIRSTPSPPEHEGRIVPQMGVPPTRYRQLRQATSLPLGSPGHNRVYSENSLPFASYSTTHLPRSGSAGSGLIDGDQIKTTTLSRSREAGAEISPPNYSAPLNQTPNSYVKPLEPLSEDEPSPPLSYKFRPSTTEPYLTNDSNHRELTRSASSMQMRDLTDKMKDLKGKISTLRDRAREENMKRRSLQSLRTPSPFTSAENWLPITKGYQESGLQSDQGNGHSAWNGEKPMSSNPQVKEQYKGQKELQNDKLQSSAVLEEPEQEEEEEEDGEVAPIRPEQELEQEGDEDIYEHDESQEDDEYETATERETYLGDDAEGEGEGEDEAGAEPAEEEYEDELVDHDELDDYESKGEGSLYHDTLTTPISHEDREDAFDYEHFFLHSAMGTLSQQGMGRRGSVDSFSSEDSVATTRGPTVSSPQVREQNGHAKGHVRNQKSVESVSSQATFATAREGMASDDSTHGAEQDSDRASMPSIATRSIFPESRMGRTKSMTDISSRPSSVIRDGETQRPINPHRPSLASFASIGTQRSFPLINRHKTSGSTPPTSMLDLKGNSKDPSTSLVDGLTSSEGEGEKTLVAMLIKDDQILVERVVASVGKCVLGLQDASRGSIEGRMFRKRLELAQRILEGEEMSLTS